MHPGAIAANSPDATAIVLGSRRIDYASLDAASRRIAVRAREAGLRRGDVLAVLAPNSPEFLAAAWGAQRSGLYFLPLSTRLNAADIAYILSDSGAKLLYIADEYWQQGEEGLAQAAEQQAACRACRFEAAETLFARAGAPADPDPVEGGDMLYTSGTTGRPKGVRAPLDFGPLGSAVSRAERLRELFDMDSKTRFLTPAPLYHAAPLRFSMALLRLGGTLVLMPGFDAHAALSILAEEHITHSQWVPTMFNRLLALDEEERNALHAPAHRVAVHAGAPCPEGLKRAMIDWWGQILHEYYSGTESIGFTHINSEDWLRHPGSVGRPWRCRVHILNDAGEECAPGETGQVYFSGRGAPAYHGAPEKTAAALSPQGYATMGDIGHIDDAGFLYLTDRRAFTIISGGVNIYPREVEDALLMDPRVVEAAVVGRPDADLGEIVAAAVELADQDGANENMAHSLRDRLLPLISTYKLPRQIAFVSAMPLTDSGKVHKARLRNEWSALTGVTYTLGRPSTSPVIPTGSHPEREASIQETPHA
ncbi:MAG: acyl-CoA synthetase [Congregibacter sp.]